MRRKMNNMYMLLLSAIVSMLGFGSCKTTSFSKKQQARQREAFIRDSLQKVEEESAREAYEAFRQDSIRRVREMEQTKCIYGGPEMMDRRAKMK